MAKDVFFENETEPIIDQLLEKYKLDETDDQALEKMDGGEYFNGGIILNAAKSVALGELNTTMLPNHLKDQLKISDTEAADLSKDILEKLVAGAEVADIPDEPEYTESETPKQNIQIEEADRLPSMPTAEPLPEAAAAPQVPQLAAEPVPAAAPTEARPQQTIKRALPKKETVSPAGTETTAPAPKVRMKKGPDTYREPIE